MTSYKIAILVGSLRKDSINRKIAQSLCAFAGERLNCDIVDIGNLPLYNQDSDENPPPEYIAFRDEIGRADGVLFVTPEYNRGMPGVLKNAIDVGSRPYGKSVFNQKPAAIVSASPGAIGGALANHQVRQSCVFLNMPVMQHPEAYLGRVTGDSFNEDGCLKDGPLKDLIVNLSGAFADWVHLIHESRSLLAKR